MTMTTMPAGAGNMPMRPYAHQQARTLLRRLAYELTQTARHGDTDSVHDLRVSIRRFSQCLRVFGQFLPGSEAKKIRRQLKEIMRVASEVRDHDITLDLLENAGIPKNSRVAAAIVKQRKQAEKTLISVLRHSSHDNFSSKWRAKLEL
jgi:CHAD domain-containing protein